MAINLSNVSIGRLFVALVACIIAAKFLNSSSSSPHFPGKFRNGLSGYNGQHMSGSSSSAMDGNGFLPLSPELEEMCSHYRWKPFPDRYHRRKVYDLVLVNDELDVLEIRMGEMDQVDYFVVVESDTTFSNKEKPLFAQESVERGGFAKYKHKMITHTLNITGQSFGDAWSRESFSRNAMFEQVFPALTMEKIPTHGDVIIIGDVDELVRPEVLTALRNCEFPKKVKLWTRFYYYSFQWLHPEGHAEWGHPDATYFEGFKNTILPQDLRGGGTDSDVYSAGWHCSYCFSRLSDMVNKVVSFSHQEMNTPNFTDPAQILQRVRLGRDMFDRGDLYRLDNNQDVPGFVLANKDRFGYMLDRDVEDGNFEDCWKVIGGQGGDEEGEEDEEEDKR